MKKRLFLFLFSILNLTVYSQRYSFSTVERVTAGGITYELEKTPFSYCFENIDNTKGDEPFVNLDGTLAEGTWEDYDPGKIDAVALEQVIREIFTAKELSDFKATNTRMTLSFIYNNVGKVIEVYFRFNVTPPVESLPLERIAQLEKRLKEKVTTKITDPATKKLQFIEGAIGYNFKYMDKK